jgi:hypothetical protein
VLFAAGLRGVDVVRVRTTNTPEVLSVFGVVAAERVQAAELHKVLCFDGTWVHPHNTLLLASAQTRTGGLAKLTRHNMRELEGGSVLHTVAFEQFLQGVEDGAVFAAADAMHGPTPRLLLGQVLRVGTGTCTVLNADGVLVGGGSGRGRAGVGPVLLPHRLRVRAAAAAAAAAASAAMAKRDGRHARGNHARGVARQPRHERRRARRAVAPRRRHVVAAARCWCR